MNDNDAFEQVHTFVLMKSETGEWQVVARQPCDDPVKVCKPDFGGLCAR